MPPIPHLPWYGGVLGRRVLSIPRFDVIDAPVAVAIRIGPDRLAAILTLTPVISHVLHDPLIRRERVDEDGCNEQCGDDGGRGPFTNGVSGGSHPLHATGAAAAPNHW